MDQKDSSNIKKGVLLVFGANVINLIISLINGFILPKFLSIETYAATRTYYLYVSYTGILALGYADGLYLKYGGMKMADVTEKDINTARTNSLIMQSIMTLICLLAGFLTGDWVFMIAAVAIIPSNIADVFKNIFQATGEFSIYSKAINYRTVLILLATILLIALHVENSPSYIVVIAMVSFIVWGILEYKLYHLYKLRIRFHADANDLKENIVSGLPLMLGNFSDILVSSIDRWFVKIMMSTMSFALYSFAFGASSLLSVFINPVATTMYNYLCNETDVKKISGIKRRSMILALFLIAAAYPVKLILEIYLTKYVEASCVIFILFATQAFFMIIKGIYANVYKAEKRQKLYFKQLLIVIFFSFFANVVFYRAFGTIEAIAFATLLTAIFWYVLCSLSVKWLKPCFRELTVLIAALLIFLYTGMNLPCMSGFCIYICSVTLLCTALMKEDLLSLINMLKHNRN